jgi:PAS domain S-box-containing protein
MARQPELPQDAETLFRAVAAVADAFYVVDAAGRVTLLNPAALQILGYDDAAELIGQPSHKTIHCRRADGSPFPEEDCPLLRPLATGETIHQDQDWFVRKDATWVAVAYSSAPVDLAGGRGAVVTFRDISDQLRVGALEASRARIAQAADGARRTIERDLHDGAQQQFVAAAMRLEHARQLLATAPDDAALMLQAAQNDLREAIAELKRLAHGIHPAELSERGLVAALRTLARRSAIPVGLSAGDLGRLAPAVEATAYYIAAEATANAIKHARATEAEIRLTVVADRLRLTVTDNGVGGAAVGRGTGLQGLHDRADAAGGRMSLVSPPGGPTVISADLPTAGPAAPRPLRPPLSLDHRLSASVSAAGQG